MGIRETLDRTCQPKYGAELFTSCSARHVIFHFRDGFHIAHHRSYQVERSTFDKLLLDNAAAHGAEVREEIGVAGGASVLAALTGIGAFGTLIAARHPALRSIGITATLVLTIGLVVAVVVIPLAMDVLLRKSGYRYGKNIG